MRLPRDVSGRQLAKLLAQFDYVITRQSGSHIRLATRKNGEHHITIPDHRELRMGTLRAILTDVADHLDMNLDELIEKIF